MRIRSLVRSVLLVMPVLLAGCGGDTSNPAPPRDTSPAIIPQASSAIAVPISASLADLQRIANAEIPRTLVTIDKQEPACLKIKIIGKISCHIVGQVTRGAVRVSGAGDVLVLTMPVSAVVSARNVAHIIKSETATAEAIATARVKLTSPGNWQPSARVALSYVWTKKPGIDFLGQRITFANKADPALARVIARLETDLPKHIAKLHPRARLAEAWAKGFTSVSLNARNPPVWLRITPQQLRFRRYDISDGRLTMVLGARALTETFVGNRPADPPATPLPPPPPGQIAPDEGFRFYLPVVADYAELEPVLERALHKLEAKLDDKPLVLPAIGTVKPRFDSVTIYATGNGRLAIGLKMAVATPGKWIDARGTVWVTGQPHNVPGSQQVSVRDLRIAGAADSPAFRLLLAVAQSEQVRTTLAGALTQNFARDYEKLLAKAGKAIAEKRLGAFVITARIDKVQNGTVQPTGQGLFMPVVAEGTAALRYAPLRR